MKFAEFEKIVLQHAQKEPVTISDLFDQIEESDRYQDCMFEITEHFRAAANIGSTSEEDFREHLNWTQYIVLKQVVAAFEKSIEG